MGLEVIFGQSFEEAIDCITVYTCKHIVLKQFLNAMKIYFLFVKNLGLELKLLSPRQAAFPWL